MMIAETLVNIETLTSIVVAVIGALFAGAALFVSKVLVPKAYEKGRSETMTITEPVPDLPFKKVLTPPTWDQHHALMARVATLEATTLELRRDMAAMFRDLLHAGGERENRLADKLDGIAREIHKRIDAQMKVCASVRCGK